MAENKTKPTQYPVDDFLSTVGQKRQSEANTLIALMQEISSHPPVMWGTSIIGFDSVHYRYASGRQGDMPLLAFSPRKTSLTIYFSEGFEGRYEKELEVLGKHRTSVSCLYINKLDDIDLSVLEKMLIKSWKHWRIPHEMSEEKEDLS